MALSDPRVERTRRAIIEATRELLLSGSGNELTLTEVAARAGYSRRAAYANFADFPGIVRAVALDALSAGRPAGAFEAAPLGEPELHRRVTEMLAGIQAESELLLRIAELHSYPILSESLRLTVEDLFEHGRAGAGFGSVDDLQRAFLVGGVVNVLREWIHGGVVRTPSAMADDTLAVITAFQRAFGDTTPSL